MQQSSSLPIFSLLLTHFCEKKKKGKEMNLPSLSKARLHIDTNYYLLLISLVITGSGSTLEFTDYPEQHKPELSECQKREFPRLNSTEKSLKLWSKMLFFFSAGCLFKWILGCNRSLWAMLADSDEKKVSCAWFVSVLSPRAIIQFFFVHCNGNVKRTNLSLSV